MEWPGGEWNRGTWCETPKKLIKIKKWFRVHSFKNLSQQLWYSALLRRAHGGTFRHRSRKTESLLSNFLDTGSYYVVDGGLKLAIYVAQARLKLSAILLPLSPKCYNDRLSPLCPANTEPQPRLYYPLASCLSLGNLTLHFPLPTKGKIRVYHNVLSCKLWETMDTFLWCILAELPKTDQTGGSEGNEEMTDRWMDKWEERIGSCGLGSPWWRNHGTLKVQSLLYRVDWRGRVVVYR